MTGAPKAHWRVGFRSDNARRRESGRVQRPLEKDGVAMQPTMAIIPQLEAPRAPQACPRCAYPGPHQRGPGAGPHHARLVCGSCGVFLRWLPKPRLVTQGGCA